MPECSEKLGLRNSQLPEAVWLYGKFQVVMGSEELIPGLKFPIEENIGISPRLN